MSGLTKGPLGCEVCDVSWHGFDLEHRILEDTDVLPPENLQREAELVISFCSYRLDWLLAELNLIRLRVNVSRITIYSKCGRDPILPTGCADFNSLPLKNINYHNGWVQLRRCHTSDPLHWPIHLTTVTMLPNRGRCDHTYAHHMATMYGRLSSLTIFIKDTSFKRGWTILKKRQHTLELMATQASRAGFSCRLVRRAEHGMQFSIWHLFEVLAEYQVGKYVTLHDQANTTINQPRPTFPSPIRPMGNWLQQSGVFSFAHSGIMPDVKSSFQQLITQSLWPVCYGGGFAAARNQICRWPQQMWQRLTDALTRGDSIEEGHYAERLWAALLAQPLSHQTAHALVCAANDQIRQYDRTRQMMGLLHLCNCTSQCSTEGLHQFSEHRKDSKGLQSTLDRIRRRESP